MNKVIVVFQKKDNAVRMPIIKAFNVPTGIDIPINATTFKISNISLEQSCKTAGYYKMVGTFIEVDNVTYLKVSMIMAISDIDTTLKKLEGY